MAELKNNVPVSHCTQLDPIDKAGLEALIKSGKANPDVIKTLKCKTVAEGRFRHANYIRDLPAYIVDEPPGLLGDDTAPNPSETLLAALGSCISVGIHANAIAQGISITKLELELEGDLNITAVWGTGDLSKDKELGFTDIRIAVTLKSDGTKEQNEGLIKQATKYSPVVNTMLRAVRVDVSGKQD